MNIDKKNIIPNILNYLRDRFSNKERYSFEKEITKDPFLEDAMDGFAQLSADELENDLILLNTRIQNRITKSKSRKLIPYLKIAAGIAIIIGISSVIIFRSLTHLSDKELAQTIDITKGLDSLQRSFVPTEQTGEILNEISKDESKEKMAQSVKQKTPKKTAIEKKLQLTADEEQTSSERTIVTNEIESTFSDDESLSETESAIAEQESIPLELSDAEMVGESSASSDPVSYDIIFSIKGVVVDADTKEPLPGANIIADSNKGTLTDLNGEFEFKFKDDSIIEIAYVGYETKQVIIGELVQNNNLIELKANNLALEEVVVVGYGTQRKQQVTGAVSRIESSEISGIPERVAGVSVNKTDAEKSNKPHWVTFNYEDSVSEHCKPDGGIKSYEKYLKKNAQIAFESNQTVKVEITIKNDGSFGEIQVLESPNENYSNEVLRLIKEGPYWLPAKLNGIKVKEKVTLTITFL